MENQANKQGRHEIKVDQASKVVQIDFFGFYGVAEAEQFFVDYERFTSPLSKKDFNIVINCKELSTFKPDILPYLKDAYKAYSEFKKVHFINPQNITGQMQLKRVAKEAGFMETFDFVNDAKELKLQ